MHHEVQRTPHVHRKQGTPVNSKGRCCEHTMQNGLIPTNRAEVFFHMLTRRFNRLKIDTERISLAESNYLCDIELKVWHLKIRPHDTGSPCYTELLLYSGSQLPAILRLLPADADPTLLPDRGIPYQQYNGRGHPLLLHRGRTDRPPLFRLSVGHFSPQTTIYHIILYFYRDLCRLPGSRLPDPVHHPAHRPRPRLRDRHRIR